MTLPPLPPRDLGTIRLGRVDQDMGYSDEAMRAYAEQAVAAERERLATHLAALHARAAGQHNYFLYLAVMLREGTLYEQETNPT